MITDNFKRVLTDGLYKNTEKAEDYVFYNIGTYSFKVRLILPESKLIKVEKIKNTLDDKYFLKILYESDFISNYASVAITDIDIYKNKYFIINTIFAYSIAIRINNDPKLLTDLQDLVFEFKL